MGMIRDCQMVSSRDGTSDVMSGLIRLLSSQYHDVCSADSQRRRPLSVPPQMADVACASVPASAARMSLLALTTSNKYGLWTEVCTLICFTNSMLGTVTGIDGPMTSVHLGANRSLIDMCEISA